jgi:toxin ParE1/3/4
MTRVIWTVRSLRSLRSIQAYISDFNPLASQRISVRLKTAGDSLADRGAPISGGRRQLTHIPPYLVRYRVAGDLVVILDIRHAAQDLD